MKNKKIRIIILITLGMIFALSNINNYSYSNDQSEEGNNNVDIQDDIEIKSPKKAYYESYIYIDDSLPNNWSFTVSTFDWCSGDGSWSNPYVIEDVEIDASGSPTDSGIFINNSKNDYFIIRNCIVYDAGNGLYDAGIKLENTSNGTLTNNNCLYNRATGILLYNDCDNNTISGNIVNENKNFGIYLTTNCHNNTITGNTASNAVSNNQDYGIYLTSNCDYNTIMANLLKNNTQYGIIIDEMTCANNLISQNSLKGEFGWHARDDGTNNHWNNSIIGNYWDNHTSPDSDKDGIVDTPYTWITGTAGNNDNFPLTESPVHDGEKIRIDDIAVSAWNWSKTAKLKAWCTGSGIISDPYIIDGLVIDGEGSENCMSIRNSKNNYFIIRNCKVTNAGSGIEAGIKLRNTNNGILTNNNCSYNGAIGILLDNDCDNNTISGNTANDNEYYGIYILTDCDNNTISGNTASNDVSNNQDYGIRIYDQCDNNTITGNTANDNRVSGIYLFTNCDNNTISGNIASNVGTSDQWDGIYITDQCNNIRIYNNTLNNNVRGILITDQCNNIRIYNNTLNDNKDYGIIIYDNCNDSIITGNTANNNVDHGIYLKNCFNAEFSENQMIGSGIRIEGSLVQMSSHTIYKNNTVNGRIIYYYINENGLDTGNFTGGGQVILINCSNSVISNLDVSNTSIGIFLYWECDNNTISGCFVDNSTEEGIYLQYYCDNNTIYNNNINNNGYSGIYLDDICYNNIISGNTINYNSREGIKLSSCDNNTISGNIVNNNEYDGIKLISCDNNTISGNTVNNNGYSGILLNYCVNNTINNNTVNNNSDYGIYLRADCDYNSITENYVYFNPNGAIEIKFNAFQSNDNTSIKANILVSSDEKFIIDGGTGTVRSLNYYLPTPPSLSAEDIAHSYSETEFFIIFNITSDISVELSDVIIQAWWNGELVDSNKINDIGNGLYNITLTPELVEPGKNPILLNMTISAANHKDKYFELDVKVDPEAVDKEPVLSLSGGAVGDDDDDDDKDDIGAIFLIIIIVIIACISASVIVVIILSRRRNNRTSKSI